MSGDPESVPGHRTKASAKAVMYLHCRRCFDEHLRPSIESFVDNAGVLYVWCKHHDAEIYRTRQPVALEIAKAQCAACASGAPHDH